MAKSLSPQQLEAIDYRMNGMSKTAALKAAGYGEFTWDNAVTRWWAAENVQAELQSRRKKLADKTDVDTAWLIRRLKAIADLDVGMLIGPEGEMHSVEHLAPELRKALSVKVVNGRVSISTDDRLKAMDQIARLAGLYEDKIHVAGEIALKDRLLEGRQRAALKNKGED